MRIIRERQLEAIRRTDAGAEAAVQPRCAEAPAASSLAQRKGAGDARVDLRNGTRRNERPREAIRRQCACAQVVDTNACRQEPAARWIPPILAKVGIAGARQNESRIVGVGDERVLELLAHVLEPV